MNSKMVSPFGNTYKDWSMGAHSHILTTDDLIHATGYKRSGDIERCLRGQPTSEPALKTNKVLTAARPASGDHKSAGP